MDEGYARMGLLGGRLSGWSGLFDLFVLRVG